MAEPDGRGRVRKAVYLPVDCWAWLEEQEGSRNDLLEGLVRLSMDEAGSTASRGGRMLARAAARPEGSARAETRQSARAGDCRHPVGRRIGKGCAECGKDPV